MKIAELKFNLFVSILVLIASLTAAYALVAQATSDEDIVYPVPELGNCKNETDCRGYCDKPQNLEPCLDLAEEHNLIPEDELEMARNFAATGGKGPGGCTSKDTCENYCNDIVNIDACLEFAEENDLMPPDELEEARKVQAALAGGAKLPGDCRNKDECEDYCESGDSSRMEECIAFAEAAGFIPEDELEEARMVLEAMKKGAKPPPCRGREECDEYCAEPDNFEECIVFAEAAGFVSPEEAEMARKTGGKGPGGCRGRECEDFCEKEENMPVCIEFAIENGLMSPEDAEMARKTGGKGPGDCRGKEECEAFCEDPVNQEVCFNFAKEHGLVSEGDLRQMEEGKQMMLEAFDNAPPEVRGCLSSALGPDFIEQLRAGTAMPSRELGDKMQECFGQMMGEMGPPEGFGSGGPDGPGGFGSSPEQIQQLRQQFEGQLPEGFQPPAGVIPSPEQIQQYQQQFQEQFQEGAPGEMQAPPSSEQIQQYQQQFQQNPYGADFAPSGDAQPPSMSPEEAQQLQQQYQQQYQQQMQQQTEQQYQQQYQQQFEQQYQQSAPPAGFTPPPDGSYMPPPDGSLPPPPPSSAAPSQSVLGNLLQSFLNLFR